MHHFSLYLAYKNFRIFADLYIIEIIKKYFKTHLLLAASQQLHLQIC